MTLVRDIKMKALLLSVIFLIGGLLIIVNPKYYSHFYGMTIDFTRIKYPLGITFVIIGLVLFWSFYKTRSNRNPTKTNSD